MAALGDVVSALRPLLAALGRRLAALRGAGGHDTFLAKGSAALEKLKDLCKEEKEKAYPSELLQLYTQAVLDITYFEENQLVDEDFPEDCSLQKVKELICILSEPEDLMKACNINEPTSILGTELLECLYWRKGALLYMYCHTVKERSEWLKENIGIFEKCLNDGVRYLMKMLSFRCPLQLDEDVSFKDKDTARLLSEGVFSDTHLLAMMYGGEMCYWGLKLCGEGRPGSAEAAAAAPDLRAVGTKALATYVAACEGPLRGQGWQSGSARQMLCFLSRRPR
ncbi:RAB7A-interacting MON1-CCZ1 complex subunit 1-like [Eudromia elegans]